MKSWAPWLWATATRQGGRRALSTEEGSVDYRSLAAGAEQVAARLASLGVGPGDSVALLCRPGHRFVELLHAVQARGARLVPLHPKLPARELDRRVEAVRPRVLLLDPDEKAGAGLDTSGVRALDASAELNAVTPRRSQQALLPFDANRPFTVLFTSGTSGTSRGVVHSSAALAAGAAASAERLGHDESDVWLQTLTHAHVGGLAVYLRACLDGAEVVIHDGFDPAAVAHTIRAGRITCASFVPTQLADLTEKLGSVDTSTLRFLLIGGASLAPSLAAKARDAGLPIATTYGLTEAGSQVATSRPGDDASLRGSSGPPLRGVSLRVVEEHRGDGQARDAEAGDRGEIWVRGPALLSAYLDGGAAPTEGWLRTGDLGHVSSDGELYVAARRSDVIVSGGENVLPTEVEAVLVEHPHVAEAAVLGLADERWGEKVVALLIASDPAAAPTLPDAIARHCAEHLAPYQRPKQSVVVAALPRTGVGKLDRSRLQQAFEAAGGR